MTGLHTEPGEMPSDEDEFLPPGVVECWISSNRTGDPVVVFRIQTAFSLECAESLSAELQKFISTTRAQTTTSP